MDSSGVGASNVDVWQSALDSLQSPVLRAEFSLEEVPAPQRLAPHSIALAVEAIDSDDEELAVGRFIVLHDPEGQDTWDGTFRVVSFVRAPMESDVVTDDLFDEVAWSWLTDALTDAGAKFHHASGTVTRTVSRSFAGLEDRSTETDLEIRASWSPDTEDLSRHMQAWLALVEKSSGLTPLPEGVTALSRKR
ncbi:MAG: DUF3000 domain-containing protein [Candidatus Nanopelagicales bacterium]|nr:DUF3000 domain-containing protein [Candidatus Nanopelagicales bacterium]